VSSRRDAVTGGFAWWLKAFWVCGRDFNRSRSRVSFAATVTVMLQAGQDSLVYAGRSASLDTLGI
jgi:hypothetical protein